MLPSLCPDGPLKANFKLKLKKAWKSSYVLDTYSEYVSKVLSCINPTMTMHARRDATRGWGNYFRTGVSSKIFSSTFLDSSSYKWLRQKSFVRRTHPTKSWGCPYVRAAAKYWGSLCSNRKDRWVFFFFAPRQAPISLRAWISIKRHVMVKGTNT